MKRKADKPATPAVTGSLPAIFTGSAVPAGPITDAAADALAALLWNAPERELQNEDQAARSPIAYLHRRTPMHRRVERVHEKLPCRASPGS